MGPPEFSFLLAYFCMKTRIMNAFIMPQSCLRPHLHLPCQMQLGTEWRSSTTSVTPSGTLLAIHSLGHHHFLPGDRPQCPLASHSAASLSLVLLPISSHLLYARHCPTPGDVSVKKKELAFPNFDCQDLRKEFNWCPIVLPGPCCSLPASHQL